MEYIATNDFFPAKSHIATDVYLSTFANWRGMLKRRPRIRFDGIYILKSHYVRYGEKTNLGLRPSFDVYSYRYWKFFPSG